MFSDFQTGCLAKNGVAKKRLGGAHEIYISMNGSEQKIDSSACGFAESSRLRFDQSAS